MRTLLWLLLLLDGLPTLAQGGCWPFGRHEPAYTRFVTNISYQGSTLSQKRTPLAKLPHKGGAAIRALEVLLDARYRALLRSDTAQVISSAQNDSIFRALLVVRTFYPSWNSVAYTQEAFFYERAQAQRQLQQLYQRFYQAQLQREYLRTAAEADVRLASVDQAAQAGQAAQKAHNWVGAEVYFARCRALHPTDSANNARYVVVAEQCLISYFSHFLTIGESFWKTAHQSASSKPVHWPAYTAAIPQMETYLLRLNEAYSACWQAGQRGYLYQQIATLLSTKNLLPAEKAVGYVDQAYVAVETYGRRYGNDDIQRTCWQLLREAEQDSQWK